MSNKLSLIASKAFIAAVAVFGYSCSSDPISESGKKVNIEMQVNRISAGFVDVTFTPNYPTFYLYEFDKVIPGVDPDYNNQAFMDLALDSAYVEYTRWRHSLLRKGERYVADFPSHSLSYGTVNVVRNFLEPDTDYWLYCFTVDQKSNKANGKLFWQIIHTEKESIFKNVRFKYRINGEWDYVYPYDITTQELVTNVPWVGQTVDSLTIRKLGYAAPGHYFDAVFKALESGESSVFTGIYAHQNNGIGDGSSSTKFEEGHTYYTGVATLDGPRNDCYDIYRFTWHGPDTEILLTDESNTLGAW